MSRDTLPPSPLYDPQAKVVNFKFAEDIGNIRLNLAGTDTLFEDPDFYYFLGDTTEWRRPKEICKKPKFINGKHNRFDALQGRVGDCWVIAAIEALTFNEDLINHVAPTDQGFDDNYIGAFHFRIWELGTWWDVVVDDRLPVYKKNKTLCHCRSRSGDVFWAALLEKAYAKFWGTSSHNLSYDVIDSGLFATSFINFTGGIVEIICANPQYRKKYGYLPSGTTLKSFLHEAYLRDALMGCIAIGRIAQSAKLGILPGHGYTITEILKCADDDPVFSYQGVGLFLLRILNPYGSHEFVQDWTDDDRYDDVWKDRVKEIDKMIRQITNDDEENDGEFWMSEVNFEKHFALVFACHLGPGQYLTTHTTLNWTAWKTVFFRGEWVKGLSAVGSDLNSRHELPQCVIELKGEENDIFHEMCYVLIHLTHRGIHRFYKNCPPKTKCELNNLGFYIYDVSTITTEGRLGNLFFWSNEPINEEPNWSGGDGRSYALGIFIDPGKYCIVPCTHYGGDNYQFLLRVFTSSQVDYWVNDGVISKSSPLAEFNLYQTEKWVHTLFDEITKDQNEIDWRGLKYILNRAFNPNPPYFGIFNTIANYIFEVFGTFSSARSQNNFGNEIVDFTKDQCRDMIAMLDYNHSGKLDFSEFSELWNKVNFWIDVYNRFRDEKSGHLQVGQLQDALSAIGYNINTRSVHSLSYAYADDEGVILLTDFVLCGVALETALSRLENEALESGKKLTLTLEKWVKYTLIL